MTQQDGQTAQDAEIRALREQLDATAGLVEELRRELADERDERERLAGMARDAGHEAQRLEPEIERLRHENQRLAGALREARARLDEREADLAVILESETYRLARMLSWPIRALRERQRG